MAIIMIRIIKEIKVDSYKNIHLVKTQWPNFDIFRCERQVPSFIDQSEVLENKARVLVKTKREKKKRLQ